MAPTPSFLAFVRARRCLLRSWQSFERSLRRNYIRRAIRRTSTPRRTRRVTRRTVQTVTELEELLRTKTKKVLIGTKAQLDLSQYAEHGCNITEAFGVPDKRPKKKKSKKSNHAEPSESLLRLPRRL